MEGILMLVLIGWAFSKMNQKAKKQVSSSGRNRNAADRRVNRMAQLRAEAEKRRLQTAGDNAFHMAEGESVVHPSIAAEGSFRGSMQTESTEGECICEPELEHGRKAEPESESVYASEIGREPLVDFSSRGILQGVVMSEILTRPAQRAGRR